MKLKTKKILAAALGIVLILFLLSFVNAWVGNPLSNALARGAAEKYIEENYSGLNLEIQRVNYNFKFGAYLAFCQSATSIDTAFSIHVDSFGRVMLDEYQYEVANHFTTFRRLDSALRVIGDKLLRERLDYNISHAIFLMEDLNKDEMLQLPRDMPLDIHNAPFEIGASITITDADVSYDKMAEVLREMERVCASEKIPISSYSVRIEYDRLESVQDGAEARENQQMSLYNIPAEVLQADDLPKALEALGAQ